MRTIIAGSRNINDYELLKQVITKSGFNITKVLCGMCRGVDLMGKKWGEENGIKVLKYPPRWSEGVNKNGGKNKAAIYRNTRMVESADALILIWDGKSLGSKDVLNKARKANLKIYTYNINIDPYEVKLF